MCLGLCKPIGYVQFLVCDFVLITSNSWQINVYDSIDCKDVVACNNAVCAAPVLEFMEAFNV